LLLIHLLHQLSALGAWGIKMERPQKSSLTSTNEIG
jgi:hypothetical protein